MKPLSFNPHLAQALPTIILLFLALFFSQLTLPFVGAGLPFLPACASVYYWALFRPSALPLWAIACVSLLHDTLNSFPLGASLSLFLVIVMGCGWLRRRLMFQQFLVAWGVFALVMMGSCLLLSYWQYFTSGIGMRLWIAAYDLPCFLTWLIYPPLHVLHNWVYHQLPREG